MDNQKVFLLAGVGIVAYLFMTSQARAAAASPVSYQVPGRTATGAPRYPTAPSVAAATEAAAYRDLGSLIGNIYRRIGGGGGGGGDSNPIRVTLPDDSVAGNPPGTVDPYSYELQTWGQSIDDLSFGG